MVERCTIGLTGDVGSGKSSVLAWMAARGAATLDADAVVHQLLAEEPALISAVAERFGAGLRGDRGIDRAALARIVFARAEDLRDLEAILHPAVAERVAAWLAARHAPVAVVEAVKLVESGLHRAFDRLWLVVCDARVRRERLAGPRGWSPEAIEARLAAAPPLAPRLALADRVIDNSGGRRATERQLELGWAGGLPCRPGRNGR